MGDHTRAQDDGPNGRDRSGDAGAGRSLPEWVSFGVATVLVAAVVLVFVVDLLDGTPPAAPAARVAGPVVSTSSGHHVPVSVRNDGDATAADVQVVAELKIGSTTLEAEQLVSFLAGGDEERLVFVFDEDPANGTLDVRVASFSKP